MRVSFRLRAATAALGITLVLQASAGPSVAAILQGPASPDAAAAAAAQAPRLNPSGPSVTVPPAAPGVVGRSVFSRTVRNADGSLSTTYAARPLYWLDPTSGQFQDFNNALRPVDVADNSAGYGQQNTANAFGLKLGKPADVRAGRPVFRFELGDASITAVAVGAQPASASVAGPRITYADAYPGVDLRYTVDNERVKEELVLAKAPGDVASASFSFDLITSGGGFRSASDGGFDFVATDGTTQFRIPGPFMTDAGAILPARSVGAVTAKLIPLGNGTLRLTLVADLTWLLDPSRVYPVVIDPTLQVVQFEPLGASGQNATISQANPNTNYNGNSLLYAGKNGSGLRQDALIKFPDFAQLPAESSIVSATLEVYAASGTAGMPIALHHNAQPWDPATVTWNTAPGTTSDVWDTDTTNVGAINTFDATSLARGWMSGDIPKEGVRLISTAPNGQTTAYYSSYYNDPNCTNCQPELEVTYVPATRYGNDRLWTSPARTTAAATAAG